MTNILDRVKPAKAGPVPTSFLTEQTKGFEAIQRELAAKEKELESEFSPAIKVIERELVEFDQKIEGLPAQLQEAARKFDQDKIRQIKQEQGRAAYDRLQIERKLTEAKAARAEAMAVLDGYNVQLQQQIKLAQDVLQAVLEPSRVELARLNAELRESGLKVRAIAADISMLANAKKQLDMKEERLIRQIANL